MRKSAFVKLQVVNVINIMILIFWWLRYWLVPGTKIGTMPLTVLKLSYLTCGYLVLWLGPWLAKRLSPQPLAVTHMIGWLLTNWLGYMLLILVIPNWFQAHNAGLRVGILLSIVGVLMMDVPRNRVIGVRSIWTLSSEHIWRKVNRLAGWLTQGAAFVLVGAGAMWPKLFPEFLIVAALVIVAIPLMVAYWLAQNDR